jgi:hypothetical protein
MPTEGAMMCNWEWEVLERALSSDSFNIVNAGPLRAPIRSFSITRNEKLELVMETRAEPDATSNFPLYPPGTVRVNTETVTLSNRTGMEVIARGVEPYRWRTSFDAASALWELREEASVYSLRGTIGPPRDSNYVIDWLSNVKGPFLWPDITDEETEITKTRVFRGASNGPTLRASNKTSGAARNCVRLNVGGCEIILCASKRPVATRVSEPGYILYTGNPSPEFRWKTRECLSFSLGTYLVYLGCSSFSSDWSLIAFEAHSAYALAGKASELPALPPSPLGMRFEWEIDGDVLSRMVNALYSHYDALDFGGLSWAYWHALCATPHIAAVHYGALVEALQRSYLRTNVGILKANLLDDEDWHRLKESVESAISGLAAPADVKTILNNKLNELNTLPQSLMADRLLDHLKIELGEAEKKAQRRRNVAAHGGATDEYVELIKDLKILRVRFHRILLSITKAHNLYYDYYSLGRPVRNLAEPIP